MIDPTEVGHVQEEPRSRNRPDPSRHLKRSLAGLDRLVWKLGNRRMDRSSMMTWNDEELGLVLLG